MSGMDHLLKAMLGIDPAELRQQTEDFARNIANLMQTMEARQSRIESKLDLILARMDAKDADQPAEDQHAARLLLVGER